MSEIIKKAVVVVLACDLARKGELLGAESEEHCWKAACVFDDLSDRGFDVTLVVSADYSPNWKKYPEQAEPMAEMMRNFLIQVHSIKESQIWTPKIRVWGTRGEIEAGYKYIELWDRQTDRGMNSGYAELHVVASWYHAARVRMIIERLYGEVVTVHTTEGSALNFFIELFKYPIQYLKMLGQKPLRQAMQ